MYSKICGVDIDEGGAGYTKIVLAPKPIKRLGFARCSIDTVSGLIESAWYYSSDAIHYEFTVPAGSCAKIILPDGRSYAVGTGSYCYTTELD